MIGMRLLGKCVSEMGADLTGATRLPILVRAAAFQRHR